ncbi:MAG: PH domain-containing protein [Methanomassiliicoccaceae archaeon]|nr:PH domain-containing protein [Methanomassiliicoccaceae archaeon]
MSGEDTYKPKISVFYYAIASAGVVALILSAVCLMFFYEYMLSQDYFGMLLFCSVLLSTLTIFIICVRSRVRFTFKENGLLINGILRKYEIGYSSITHVTEDDSFAAFYYPGTFGPATALSLDQILIGYGATKKIYIAPEKKQEFLSKLEKKLPNPSVLVRAQSKGR